MTRRMQSLLAFRTRESVPFEIVDLDDGPRRRMTPRRIKKLLRAQGAIRFARATVIERRP